MKVSLVRYTPAPDEICGQAAALCYHSESPERSLRGALRRGHGSVSEHNAFTFRVEGVSRVLLAQITRHRIASFSVESQRYCGANLDVVIPPSLWDAELVDEIIDVKRAIEKLYHKAVSMGKPAEDARYFTLQAGKTAFFVTMNARELAHFFELRCCNRAQWEIRELAWHMLRVCKEAAPELFKKAGPPCMFGSCPEGRNSCGKPYKEGQGHE